MLIGIFFIVGLAVGSFLNVVIHRLPLMMAVDDEPGLDDKALNLAMPRSHCPHCGHPLRWFENLPVVSYLALRGRCSACKASISPRYPLVEITTALMFAFCAWRFGLQGPPHQGLAAVFFWCFYCAMLLALACIDFDHSLLPDSLTQPLLWAGLIAAALHLTSTTLSDSLWGAVAGYMSLWLIFWAFKLATGKEGMGFGDFKLYAALGAWLGWQALIPLMLLASILGIVMALVQRKRQIPFGPFVAFAGFAFMAFMPWLSNQGLVAWLMLK